MGSHLLGGSPPEHEEVSTVDMLDESTVGEVGCDVFISEDMDMSTVVDSYVVCRGTVDNRPLQWAVYLRRWSLKRPL